MKRILWGFLLCLFSIAAFGKGGSGIYFISGTAYGKANELLKNTTLEIKIGETTKTIQTNQDGKFEIEVLWRTTCSSKITEKEYEKENNKINPEFICVVAEKRKIKIRNTWKKYARSFPNDKEQMTRKMDLHFS